MGVQGLIEVGGKIYTVKKRFIRYNGKILLESDSNDIHSDGWDECEVQGENKGVMGETFLHEDEAASLALGVMVGHRIEASFEDGCFAGKKGRRRGQRKSEQRRTEKWKRG